ncbi:MAG TPA: HAMP domain-containing sensor histidine kinase, partial [Candidatus Eremiobacteraceae bacterium]|nr:HAMP domain-containing sensor histidine kinase [Candidatus Eremiobacteraceae bacterium]
ALRRERSPDEYRDALETIAGEAGHIEELVSELLALARAEADRAPSVGPVNLTPLVVDAAHRLEPLARARDVTIATDVCSNAYLMGDPVDLAHLPVALLHNAVKYARDGGRVVLTLDAPNGAIRLRVRDDGSGFSAEGLQRATERFWRQDGVRGRSGSGLGLAIVRAMVERFGGTIALRNADAGGAEVVVEFPAATPV